MMVVKLVDMMVDQLADSTEESTVVKWADLWVVHSVEKMVDWMASM